MAFSLTWKCRMIIHIKPSMTVWFPSTMSDSWILTSLIYIHIVNKFFLEKSTSWWQPMTDKINCAGLSLWRLSKYYWLDGNADSPGPSPRSPGSASESIVSPAHSAAKKNTIEYHWTPQNTTEYHWTPQNTTEHHRTPLNAERNHPQQFNPYIVTNHAEKHSSCAVSKVTRAQTFNHVDRNYVNS